MDIRIKTDLTSEVLSRDDLTHFIKYEDDQGQELLLIDDMIASVRSHFEKRTGLSFAEKTYEVFFRKDEKPFVLPISPIISVDKVEVIDIYGEKTELTLNTEYFKRGLYEVEIRPTGMITGQDLLITFKAGYGNTATETLPEDLKDAMRKQIKQWYDNRDDFYEFKILGSIDKILSKHKKQLL